MTLPDLHTPRPIAEFIKRHETLRMIREWFADLVADHEEADTSIAWEDGEEHDDEDIAA